jgi:hypothetical protein
LKNIQLNLNHIKAAQMKESKASSQGLFVAQLCEPFV